MCSGSARLRCNANLLHTAPDACRQNAHCQPGESAECVCDSGFTRDGSGACVDIVDCVAGTCAGGTCTDFTNRFECSCGPGYVANQAKTACNDIVDCVPNVCGAGGSCVEMVGGYECSCATGYLPTADRQGCVPACTTTSCEGGICTDGPSGYTCDCSVLGP